MATTKKALAMAEELVSELRQRQSALAVALSFDTDGSPLVKLGTGVAGAKGGLIKIQPIDWPLAKDILGLSSPVYSPHVVKLGVEANFAGTTDNVADINTWTELLLLVAVCTSKGAKVEVYQSANATAPTAALLGDSTKLVATFDPNVQYPMISSQ